jgi:anaerobic nitric oxide reductase flavorubredoxin
MKKQIKNNVYWVGKTDWDLRYFHGFDYSTHKGSSYNSYLVCEEKTALIDTVWKPYSKEFIENLSKEIDLNKIDYIIANHAEVDHSGALPALMESIPDKPIYCTARGIKSLTGHYHKNWNFHAVKTGDKISLGKKDLIFIEANMLHWPDSMFCYLTGDNILFSNDAFGQHYSTELLFNDLVDTCDLFREAIKYYANILTPFSDRVKMKIEEFVSLNLPLDIICTSHGVIWRDNPMQIVQKYIDWSSNYQENQITIVYDTMWDGTRIMAENIVEGIKSADTKVTVKLFNSAKFDKNDIITEIFKSKAVLFGSPTVNHGVLYSTAGILEFVKGLGFKNKKASSFGAYGWSGESVKVMNEQLQQGGFKIVDEGLRLMWRPDDEESTGKAVEYGRKFVELIK